MSPRPRPAFVSAGVYEFAGGFRAHASKHGRQLYRLTILDRDKPLFVTRLWFDINVLDFVGGAL